jgi:RhtB (resistance to homoserine/threonine) family protein
MGQTIVSEVTSLVPPAPQLLTFLFVAGLLTITPGADMALVMRHALGGGRRNAFLATLGICLGTLVWGAASALGVSVLFARSVLAFTVLKYVGGAYLVYLGLRALRDALGNQSTTKITKNANEINSSSPSDLRGFVSDWRSFGEGLLTNLLNPKVAVFYATFLPQFVVPDRPVLSQSVFLAFTHVVMGLIWLTFYARFINRMAAVLLTERVKRRIEAVTGAVLMALGIRLALTPR